MSRDDFSELLEWKESLFVPTAPIMSFWGPHKIVRVIQDQILLLPRSDTPTSDPKPSLRWARALGVNAEVRLCSKFMHDVI